MMKKQLFGALALILFFTAKSFGQAEDTLLVPDLFGTNPQVYLNTIIANDTAGTGWQGANGVTAWQNRTRVYVLKMNGLYPTNAVINLNANRSLKIRAEGVPVKGSVYMPMISFYPSGTGNPAGNFVSAVGANDTIIFKKIMMAGYNEGVPGNLDGLQGSLIQINTGGTNSSLFIDSCILKSTNGQLVQTAGKPRTVRITNSIFADMGFLGTSNFGAGKGVDLRNVEVDTLDMQYNTFINYQDRIVRHLVSTAPIHNFLFNHNTVVNGVGYDGFLSLGWVDSTGSGTFQIKNNLLIDHFAFGCDTDVVRQVEFSDPGELDPLNSNPRMAWVLARPNANVHWDISNNYYAISDSGAAMRALPSPQYIGPKAYATDRYLTTNINSRLAQLGGDSVNCFKKVNVSVVKAPALMTNMIRWYYTSRANGGAGKEKRGASGVGDPNFVKTAPGIWTFDYNRRDAYWYFDSLNAKAKASASTVALLVSSDGKVIGDPRWGTPLTSVRLNDISPIKFTLDQNYPNPFNPSTTIKYQVPVNGLVSLKVYNVVGQEVATLVNEVQAAAGYETSFDASQLSTGVYFYTLRAGNFVETKKMLLLK